MDEITVEEYKTLLDEKKSKYNAKKVKIDNFVFDSTAEAKRYRDLKLMEREGSITCLQVHPVYLIHEAFSYKGKKIRAIHYEADFYYLNAEGMDVVEDVKGVETDVFKLKKKLFLKLFGDTIDFRLI